MPFPSAGHATVVAVDPNARTISVVLPSGQGISTVRPLHYGPADGMRIEQRPLPRPGTTGLCFWPYGDSRNGVWAGAVLAGLIDAAQPGDADADYTSHWSGYYRLLTGTGEHYETWPDGSYKSRSTTPGKPALTRHTVDETTQKRSATAFPDSDRVTAPPAPMPYRHHHASGTEVNIDAAGNTSVALASGQTLTLSAGGTTITVNGSGEVSVVLAGGSTLGVGNGSFSDFLVLASKLVAVFNAHTHTSNGAGVPTHQIAATDINSTVVQVSS